MKTLKNILALIFVSFCSGLLFLTLAAGAPEGEKAKAYQVKAGALAIGICTLIYGCFRYIGCLQKELLRKYI